MKVRQAEYGISWEARLHIILLILEASPLNLGLSVRLDDQGITLMEGAESEPNSIHEGKRVGNRECWQQDLVWWQSSQRWDCEHKSCMSHNPVSRETHLQPETSPISLLNQRATCSTILTQSNKPHYWILILVSLIHQSSSMIWSLDSRTPSAHEGSFCEQIQQSQRSLWQWAPWIW